MTATGDARTSAARRALASAGSRIATRIEMMPITATNSTSVNARRRAGMAGPLGWRRTTFGRSERHRRYRAGGGGTTVSCGAAAVWLRWYNPWNADVLTTKSKGKWRGRHARLRISEARTGGAEAGEMTGGVWLRTAERRPKKTWLCAAAHRLKNDGYRTDRFRCSRRHRHFDGAGDDSGRRGALQPIRYRGTLPIDRLGTYGDRARDHYFGLPPRPRTSQALVPLFVKCMIPMQKAPGIPEGFRVSRVTRTGFAIRPPACSNQWRHRSEERGRP